MGEALGPATLVRRRLIIERPRLTRLLDNGEGRIKLLVGPAGYGKTTLARQWLEDRHCTWYRGTPASADVAALAAGLRKAVADIVTGSGAALMERLPVTRRPEEEAHVLAEMLAGDLTSWPPEAWLVFDDYQMIAGTAAAERFVECLLLSAPLNVLLMTRQRPSWASSRRILYGEVFALDRGDLAMTDDEAHQLLADIGEGAAELVEVAQGWPAVLGLASTASVPPPDFSTAPHLYGFFAEEIYQRIDRSVRRVLCELALYDVEGRRLAIEQLRWDEAERVVRAGIDNGFLTETTDGRFDMHPLLRAFLERKLKEESPKAAKRVVARAVDNLIQHELWDEAFELTQRFSDVGALPRLLDAASVSMLTAGRVPTLRGWIRDAAPEEPIVRLVSAEIAFSEGRFHEAQVLAALAAEETDVDPDRLARAHLVGARAAHVASHEEEAGALYARAGAIANSTKLKQIAALGELLVAIELERPDAADLLHEFDSIELIDPTERVILADRKLSYEIHFMSRVDVEGARAARQLLNLVSDPLVRTSFRNVFGYTLAALGLFDESLELTDEQLVDVSDHRLEFVLPYAYSNQALAKAGLREYVEAHDLFEEAKQRALRSGDRTAFHISWAMENRVCVAQAAFDRVMSRALRLDADLTHQLRSELTASYALAAAGAGYLLRAQDLAREARRRSVGVETLINSELVHAIVALREGMRQVALGHVRCALDAAVRTGMVESFVFAYRGLPEILVCLMEDATAHDDMTQILTLVHDFDLLGDGVSPHRDHSILTLTPREKEVLSLLAQGLSNRQIGEALFISPVTAKVHVRHIYAKLGVSSRAAAALRAAQLDR
jgi:LuxR family transcriptional regulator, maltose regulon positive regulatory protein